MILDTNLMLANAVAVNAVAGTATVANVIDMGAGTKNPFAGEKIYAVFNVTTAFTSAGAAVVEFRVVSDGQDPVLTDGTATFAGTSGPIPLAQLTLGARFYTALNPLGLLTERFLGLNIITTIATTTAGSISCHIVGDRELGTNWRAYADAVN